MYQINKGRIRELDGLRAFAALSVVLYHFSHSNPAVPVSSDFASQFIWFLGIKGVDVFFVISGFVITLQLMREYGRAATVDLYGFYIKRVFRSL